MRGLPKRDCGDYSVGAHLFPFRTEKLSPTAPMVLPYRWESRSSPNTIALQDSEGLFCFKSRTDARRSGIPTPPVYALIKTYTRLTQDLHKSYTRVRQDLDRRGDAIFCFSE